MWESGSLRRWDVKLNLPNESDRVMHSVDVTPEMKESVMEGQPMFGAVPDEDIVNH